MACSFSAVGDPSRLSGSRPSQARYSSWSATSVATAASQRCGGQDTRRRRGGVGVVRPALLGPVPRLPLGRGHWHGADATCRHLDLLLASVTSRFPTAFTPSFFVRLGTVSPSRPGAGGAPRAAAVKTGPPKGRGTAAGGLVLRAASTAPGSAGLGLRQHDATPPFCARADPPCSGSDAVRASSHASRPRAPVPDASNSRRWGRSELGGFGA